MSTPLTSDQSFVLDISEESADKQDSIAWQDLDSGAVAYYTAEGFGAPGMERRFRPTPRPPDLPRTLRPELRLVVQ